MTVMTHVMELEAGQSSRGTFEPNYNGLQSRLQGVIYVRLKARQRDIMAYNHELIASVTSY